MRSNRFTFNIAIFRAYIYLVGPDLFAVNIGVNIPA